LLERERRIEELPCADDFFARLNTFQARGNQPTRG
jgi:hypothetical protein